MTDSSKGYVFTTTKELTNAEKFIKQLYKRFKTKVGHDGILENNKASCDILGLEIDYDFVKTISFGMEKSLTEKIPLLEVPLNKNGKLLSSPGPPNKYIEDDYLNVKEQQYRNNVKWLQKIVGLTLYVGKKYRFDMQYYINAIANSSYVIINCVLLGGIAILNLTGGTQCTTTTVITTTITSNFHHYYNCILHTTTIGGIDI